MNRISIIAATAFAITTGCAEGTPEMDVDALAAAPFAGITPTLPVIAMNQVPDDGGTNAPADWAPADLPEGAYWMTIQEVHQVAGTATASEGSRQLVAVKLIDGVPMLHGMAPIYSDGESLTATYVDEFTAPVEDGRCRIVTELMADGVHTGPDRFSMDLMMADIVEGEDCEKMGLGEEQFAVASFVATFDFIPPVIEDVEKEGEEAEGPNGNI